MRLLDFYHNRSQSIQEISLQLKEHILSRINNPWIHQFFKVISNSYGFPKDVLERQTAIFWEGAYEYREGHFSKKLKLSKVFQSYLQEIGFLLYCLLFSKGSQKRKDLDIVIDFIENNTELNRFSSILSYFENSKIGVIEKTSTVTPHGYERIEGVNYKSYDRGLVLKSLFLEIFYVLPLCLIFSLLSKENLIALNLHFLNQTLFYRSLSKRYKCKSLLQEKHYQSSAIKRFIFNKEMDGIVTTFQKNIHQTGRNGFFYDFDVFFALGEKTFHDADLFGANVKEVVPVGSVFMENLFLSNPERVELEVYDLVFVGINTIQALHYLDCYDSFMDDYYECFEWLAKFSKIHSEVKIGIKHHPSLRNIDSREKSILEGSSVVYIDKMTNSYQLCEEAKAVCTFGSTMGFELIGHGKDVLMLDPHFRGAFLAHSQDFYKEYCISKFADFERRILELLEGKGSLCKNRRDFCVESRETSKLISTRLKEGQNG